MTLSSERSGSGQSGIASVWAIAWIFVCLTVGWVALALGVAVAGQHHVDAAADLTSLSAARTLQHAGAPCRTASVVAAANGVALTGCRVDGDDVVVAVRARLNLPFGLHPWVGGQARAGPG